MPRSNDPLHDFTVTFRGSIRGVGHVAVADAIRRQLMFTAELWDSLDETGLVIDVEPNPFEKLSRREGDQ